MLILFAITLFISAFLFFWVQPMFGKMILPLLGSTPSVWNTCMCFFQGTLLLGYLYAHGSIKFLGVKKQSLLQIVLLFIPLLFLPIRISLDLSPPTDKDPSLWLLMLLFSSVFIPLFIVSTSAPMLQKWFSATKHNLSSDPYFLYAASNSGSLFALVGYIILLEPNFRLFEQSNFWSIGYFILIALIIFCAIFLWKFGSNNFEETLKVNNNIIFKEKILWVILAFVPSSLLLGVTTYLSTDIAAVPLIWVLPLIIYLLTFIIVFSKKPIFSHNLMMRIMPILVLPMIIYLVTPQTKIIWLTILLHLLTFFVCAMVCHGELVKRRPEANHLTEFYLLISLGGFLGGIFNALIAPQIFNTVLEYPFGIVLACLLRPRLNNLKENLQNKIFDFVLPMLLLFFCIFISKVIHGTDFIKVEWLKNIIVFGIPLLICFTFINRPLRFGFGVGFVILALMFHVGSEGKILLTKRSFFGVHRVVMDKEEKFIELVHGRTVHGRQKILKRNICEPLTYYHRTGPIGQCFGSTSSGKKLKIGAIGLGAGSLACYGKENDEWTFFEIDSVVKDIAQNKNYFTFLTNSQAMINITLGDGRLSIKKSPDSYFNLIVLDAFSSDSIPTHLLTKEAIELYLKKLKSNGVLAFHISNQYLNLKPVLGSILNALNLIAFVQEDLNLTKEEYGSGKSGSVWVLVARKKEDLGKIILNKKWNDLKISRPKDTRTYLWTDDFSNIVKVLKWRQ